MGWLTEKYMHIIKAPYYLYFKESREVRRLVLNLRKIYAEIEKLPNEVEREHKIRESIKKQKKVIHIALSGLKAEYKMVINLQIEEDIVLGIIKKIEDRWIRVNWNIERENREKHDSIVKVLRELDDMMDQAIIRSMVMCMKGDRALYGDIMNLINEANTPGKFMKAIKIYMKKLDVSRLERWAGKFEALGVRKHLNRIKTDKQILDQQIIKLGRDLNIMDKGGKKVSAEKKIETEKDFESVVKRLRFLIKGMEQHISRFFFDAYKAIRRDFMMTFVLLSDLNELRGYVKKWVGLKQEPWYPEEQILKDIKKAEQNVIKNSYVIAQGLRIVYHKAEAIYKRAKS